VQSSSPLRTRRRTTTRTLAVLPAPPRSSPISPVFAERRLSRFALTSRLVARSCPSVTCSLLHQYLERRAVAHSSVWVVKPRPIFANLAVAFNLSAFCSTYFEISANETYLPSSRATCGRVTVSIKSIGAGSHCSIACSAVPLLPSTESRSDSRTLENVTVRHARVQGSWWRFPILSTPMGWDTFLPRPRGQPDSLAALDARGTSSLWKGNARPVSASAPCAAASRNLSPSLYLIPHERRPPHFNARAMARWLASRGRPHAKRQTPGPRPTLGDLQRSHC
jgi:hypothetical protein